MIRITRLTGALVATSIAALTVAAEPVQFAQALRPVGVVADAQGNVWISSDNANNPLDSSTSGTLISKWSAQGQQLGAIRVGGFASINAIGRLARDPESGVIWGLFPDGTVFHVTADGRYSPSFNVRSAPLDLSRIFDLQSGTLNSLGGLIQPQTASYGDIALLRRGRSLDVFITGYSAGFPFVVRIRYPEQGNPSGAVVAATRATLGMSFQSARGIAVNRQGTVVTTMPVQLTNERTIYERLVAFSADFPEGRGNAPSVVFTSGVGSQGMDVDPAGNFLIATGSAGNLACGPGGSGAILVVRADLRDASCLLFPAVLADSRDVAVSPRGDVAYVSVAARNVVVRFPLTPAQSAAPSPQPRITAGGVASAASYANHAVAPGEIVVLFGTAFAPQGNGNGQPDPRTGRMPTAVAGTRVLFDDVAAPVLFVTPEVIGAVVPYRLNGGGSTRIRVQTAAGTSSPVEMPVVAAKPGIFTLDSSGSGPAAAADAEGKAITPANPVQRGSYLVFYATGDGQQSPAAQDGLVGNEIRRTRLPVSVRIGGVPVEVLYSGYAPGNVSGLMQVNVRLGADVPAGAAVPLELQVGEIVSRPGVTLAVR
jgi:uncharacterized protein (TIGR03437 family)